MCSPRTGVVHDEGGPLVAGKSKHIQKAESDLVIDEPLDLDSEESILGNIALQ